ncbi:putative acyltransferase [Trypanosoma vivax]|uniref:Putative acyltransferase n=1 Tax=Trypanosoma vivax (strain Y486) TaxID=1055687 RepID=G0TT06_TRYVY|nr:putative acyltransferase [Trypanosoma vivax]CCC47087.1 putative acyltransferase [Trypanosoma vivax Y486]
MAEKTFFRLLVGLLVTHFLCSQIFATAGPIQYILNGWSSVMFYWTGVKAPAETSNALSADSDGWMQLGELTMCASAILARLFDPFLTLQGLVTALSHLTWLEFFWKCFLTQLLFSSVLFNVEVARSLLFTGPRRLRLDNSYITAEPPRVGRDIALSYDTPWSLYEVLKVLFFAFTGILFVRIILFVIFAASTVLALKLRVLGGRNRENNPLWFLIFSAAALLFFNLSCCCMAIYNIKVFGKFSNKKECKLLISNHSCVVEVCILFMLADCPSFVTRWENRKVPLFGMVADTARAIFVHRESTESRHVTAREICARARNKDPNGPQLLIFPEGTTANQRALFMFKKGAMEPGEPIQMICVSFPYKHFNPCWNGRGCGGNNFRDLTLRLCSQFVNHVEIRALPVYTPTDEERENPTLYAGHCQKMMASILGCGISDCTYADYANLEERPAQKSIF